MALILFRVLCSFQFRDQGTFVIKALEIEFCFSLTVTSLFAAVEIFTTSCVDYIETHSSRNINGRHLPFSFCISI